MDVQDFEAKVKHLSQSEMLAGAISSLNKLLVDKGIVNSEEVQGYFLEWMEEHKLAKANVRGKRTGK